MPFILVLLVAVTFGTATSARAQTQAQPAASRAPRTGAVTLDEATALTQGWAFLAEGHVDRAASRAADILAIYPRSASALVLSIEAEIARGGARAALDQYERWLGARAFEEPAVVRRIATVLLKETIAGKQMDTAALEARQALAWDGDRSATAELAAAAAKAGGVAEARLLAAMGDERGVSALAAHVKGATGSSVLSMLTALGDSGSKAAVAPIVDRLRDPTPEIRGAAVDALGKLGRRHDVIDQLRPMMEDKTSYVQTRAAAALFALGDMSGAPLLRGLMQEESAVTRFIAVQAMASQPDAAWLDAARHLTSAAEPHVRIGAARLLAPHDPALARQVFDSAMNDPNPAIREMASEGIADVAGGDLRLLRHLLKLSDRLGRVRAAARILGIVR